MKKEDEALQKYKAAVDAAWRQRQQAIKLGATASDYDATYYAALEVAKAEYREIVPAIVQPSGVD